MLALIEEAGNIRRDQDLQQSVKQASRFAVDCIKRRCSREQTQWGKLLKKENEVLYG